MSYSNESAKQFRAILADDPSQGPAILKHLQAGQATEGRQLKLPRAVLAYELRYGAAPAGLTLAAIRAAIVAPDAANAKAKPSTKAKPAAKAKPVPAKAAAMTDKPSGRAKAKPAAKPAAKPDYRAQVSEIINTNAQRTIDQIMALDVFA